MALDGSERWVCNTVHSRESNSCCCCNLAIGPVGKVLKCTDFMTKSAVNFST